MNRSGIDADEGRAVIGRPGKLTGHLVQELGRAIVTERYTPATPFPFEAEIASRYGASRTIVREAVKMLTAKGLLRSRQRAGTIVRPESEWNLFDPDVLRWLLQREFSTDLLIDFTEIRLATEARAAALAARSATAAQHGQIADAMDRISAAERGDDDPLEADIAFHAAILLASNNRFLRQFTEFSEATLRYGFRRADVHAGSACASAADHQAIAVAIRNGNASLASWRMSDLIQDTLALLLAADGDKDAVRA